MLIVFSKLTSEGTRFVGNEAPSILDLDGESDVMVREPLQYDLTAFRVARQVIVRGTLTGRAMMVCVRCAKPFTAAIGDAFFERAYDLDGPDVPWGEEQDSLDLTADIREATLLSFPSHPVCRPDCRGLCPHCGADWNVATCNCREEPDPRWGVLDRLTKGS